MINRLPAIPAAVDDHAVAGRQMLLCSYQVCHMQQVAGQCTVQRTVKARDRLTRNDQDMRGRLGCNVPKGYTVYVLVYDISRNLAPDDALKECVRSHDLLLLRAQCG